MAGKQCEKKKYNPKENATYRCKKCQRTANQKKKLCKPELKLKVKSL